MKFHFWVPPSPRERARGSPKIARILPGTGGLGLNTTNPPYPTFKNPNLSKLCGYPLGTPRVPPTG